MEPSNQSTLQTVPATLNSLKSIPRPSFFKIMLKVIGSGVLSMISGSLFGALLGTFLYKNISGGFTYSPIITAVAISSSFNIATQLILLFFLFKNISLKMRIAIILIELLLFSFVPAFLVLKTFGTIQ